jgi:Fur family ferric uptake transcriptional regulator
MSNKLEDIVDQLREKGNKITSIRRAVLEILIKETKPLAAGDIIALLKRYQLEPHKTTVYRELDFLIDKQLIREVVFDDGQIRYEKFEPGHFHHLICLSCKKVDKIELSDDLDKEEKTIERKMRFKVKRHSLEFYGVCSKCNKR